VAIIRSWRSWVEGKNEMMITKDSIIRRNADGSMFHYSAPMPLPGFGRVRDAAPVGSEVGGIGEASFGYAENNRTMRSFPQGRIANTDPQREDGAYRHVLARWKTGGEVEIVEEGDSAFLLLWEPPRPGEGRPQSAITADPISRSATTMNDPEKSFADPPVGPRSAVQDAHRQMFDRIRDHDSKKPVAARRTLAAIKRGIDASESINAANREFWSGK
jgi:hypothetical protein